MAHRTVFVVAAATVTFLVVGSLTSAEADVRTQNLQLLDTGATIDVFLNGGDPSHVGDREVFRDTLVSAKDHGPAGKADGHCTVIEPTTATTTCTIVTTLQRGTLTTEGIGTFVPGAQSTAAITGGTGAYEGATGHATFVVNPGGESPISFSLAPH
ncbi:allene oxide cyclase barrel-like domain-containing protein [Kribbella sp. NBC_00359]|uniref:allene oxide cyclase barrel-like domain-containing protein n=1 Tax=Kribbella sp. NBC_00359 TaxID=2975966 RepID=UPI002E1F5992